MNARTIVIVISGACLAYVSPADAQLRYIDRLPIDALAVTPPADRVIGQPGEMRIRQMACRSQPLSEMRQRIVDIAVQEWAYFGFSIVDETAEPEPRRQSRGPRGSSWRRFSWMDPEESQRLAASIAGYWAATSDGAWILSRQNEIWAGADGVGARWRDPWSAAFISWVMCESGLGESSLFRRAIAHHTYIDQAIQARDDTSAGAAFIAYNVGERRVEPGDLLCAARRPTYSSIEERRSQLGEGIRSHCDIVVKLEVDKQRILAIGGNVRGSVSLKLLPAEIENGGPAVAVRRVGRGRGTVFAHLKLRADSVDLSAFENSATLRRLAEQQPDAIEGLRRRIDSGG